ncbi:MAG: hypothetical protein RIQ60_674 [Pseudomonadota bacterium]|jgi:hypothetical protein
MTSIASPLDMVFTWGPTKAAGYELLRFSPPAPPGGVVRSELATLLPTDTLIHSATAIIQLAAAPDIAAGEVAQVRQGDSNSQVVLDFGALRTVSSLSWPADRQLVALTRWVGDTFQAVDGLIVRDLQRNQTFADLQTERLCLSFDQSVTPARAATGVRLAMPSAPSGLELEVGGTLAWAHAAPVRLRTDPAGGATAVPAARFEVEVTAALQAALARGANPVLRLSSATPCAQTLGLRLNSVRVHQVNLPPSGIVVDTAVEDIVDTFLPLPPQSASWQVSRVELGVSGSMPSWRAWPLPDPALNTSARLVIDPGHSYAARLPADWLAPLAELSGIRLPLVLPRGFAGAELVALLYDGTLEAPIAPVAAARFKPSTVAPAPDGEALRWVELSLSKPLRGPAKDCWWVEVSATRGRCEWPLSAPPGSASGASALSDEVVLRRSLPGPPFRPLAVQLRAGVDALWPAARLRVLGTPRRDDLRPGVVPTLDGALLQVAPGFTPSPRSGVVSLALPEGAPASAASGHISNQQLRLRMRVHGAGQFSFSSASVHYSDSSSGPTSPASPTP